MDREEVDEYITGLEAQLAEMKRIVFGEDQNDKPSPVASSAEASFTSAPSNEAKEVEALRTENQKLAYRVNMLLRTISEKRARIAQLEER
ncbi:hypothetical protein HDU83_009397 [Entophlyctis luteolus]|nr:hypothetical protein HDU83_009397 [Entophlyctis luteolus]